MTIPVESDGFYPEQGGLDEFSRRCLVCLVTCFFPLWWVESLQAMLKLGVSCSLVLWSSSRRDEDAKQNTDEWRE